MLEPQVVKTSVYIAIPEMDACTAVAEGLPNNYLVRCCASAASLMSAISDAQPELIICHDDLVKEITVIADIKAASPTARILILGPGRPIEGQIAVLKQGARGYFDNHLPIDKLVFALQGVLHGEVWVERHVISSLIDELTQVTVPVTPSISEKQQQALNSLTPKEVEVATLVSHGATNKMIAHKLEITERTVKAHLTMIFQKMSISDRLSLAIFFRDLR